MCIHSTTHRTLDRLYLLTVEWTLSRNSGAISTLRACLSPSPTRAPSRFSFYAGPSLVKPQHTYSPIPCTFFKRTLSRDPPPSPHAEDCVPVTPPPICIYYTCIGWVGVGCQRHSKTCRSILELQETTRVPFCFLFFWRSVTTGGRVGLFVLSEGTRGLIVSCSVHGKAPKRQVQSTPIAVSGSGHTGK